MAARMRGDPIGAELIHEAGGEELGKAGGGLGQARAGSVMLRAGGGPE